MALYKVKSAYNYSYGTGEPTEFKTRNENEARAYYRLTQDGRNAYSTLTKTVGGNTKTLAGFDHRGNGKIFINGKWQS